MRIGEFTDTFLPIADGVGRVVHAYAVELTRMGHQVTVVAPMYNTGYRGGYPFDLVDFVSVKVPTTPQYRTGTPTTDAHYRRRILASPLDILHAHAPFATGREALRLAKARNLPLVASFHSKYYDDFYKATRSETLTKMVLSNVINYYEKCDEVWAVSDSTAEVLRSYGYKGPITVMPNGATMRKPRKDAMAQVEAQFQLDDTPMLLFVGQLNWKKNLLRVLEACTLLRDRGVAFRLVLAGQGPDEDAIREKVGTLGLEQHCLLTGHIQEAKHLDALYKKASLFVFPSLYDNAPMVVREAAVMGTPSVLIRGSDAAEVVTAGENGLLCEDTSEDLANVLQQALQQPDALTLLGEHARDTIPIPWSDLMVRVVDNYERIIRDFRGRKRSFLQTRSTQ